MKYVISWPYRKVDIMYYQETTFKDDDWDTYGTMPHKVVMRTDQLCKAMLFDTKDKAITELAEKIGSPYTAKDTNKVRIIGVTEKEIFKAVLGNI